MCNRLHSRLHQPDPEAGDPDRPIEVNRFRMPIPVAGYCWLDDAAPSRLASVSENARLLGPAPHMAFKGVDGSPVRSGVLVQWSLPLIETPDLFHKFRDLDLDRDSILRFANQYGWIGPTGHVEHQNRALIPAVGIQTWITEIQAMIVADQLLAWAKSEDLHCLKRYFTWSPTQFDVRMDLRIYRRRIWAEEAGKIPDPHRGPMSSWHEWLVRPGQAERLQAIGWKRGDLVGPARLAAMNTINIRLEKLCHPRLYLDGRGGLTGHWTPVNLLGCTWLQLYLSIIGQLKLHRCTVCGEEMDVTGLRSTRKMHDRCSKRVRMSKWRARKRPQVTGGLAAI